MNHTLKVTIPYEAGLSDTEMLLKVTRAVTDAASKKKGWRAGGYTPDRDFSDVRDALQRNKRNQTVTLTKTRSGITARRVRASPSVAIADASGALDLEAAARKYTPELTGFALSQMADKLGARKTALDTAIYGTPGLDRSMRLSAISGAGDDGAMAKVVGYEPNRGTRIDSMAAGKLKALIQKVMLDLNVDTGDKRTEEAQRLLERSFRTKFTLLEQDLVDEFRLMIKAYHEVRLMNLPYIESMMVGMDGAEFPDVLLSMLAPSPDDFLQGTDAMLIIDSKNRPEEQRIMFSSITDTILDLWSRILNTREKDKPVLNTDKQQEVASLLSAFKNDRTKMVRAIETACRKARRRGGDFIDAFTPYPLRAVGPIPGGEKKYAADLKELVVKAADNAISEEGPLYQLDFGRNDAKAEAIFNEMEGKGLSNRIGDTEYFIVPMSMPRFSTRPIGWDRRWMVATMRIVDEYWNILYSENGMFITDLLYLISSRAYELFNYTMDAEDLYLLTLLLVGEDGVEAAEEDEEAKGDEEAEGPLEEIAEVLVETVASEAAEDKEEGDEEEEAEDFDEEAFDGDISPEDLESIDLGDLDEDEGDEDPMAGMGTGARRRGRKARRFTSGILPKTSGRKTKRLKTIGDMLGISGVAKGLNKEITKLERELENEQEKLKALDRKNFAIMAVNKNLNAGIENAVKLRKDMKDEYDKLVAEQKDVISAIETKNSARLRQLEKDIEKERIGFRETIEDMEYQGQMADAANLMMLADQEDAFKRRQQKLQLQFADTLEERQSKMNEMEAAFKSQLEDKDRLAEEVKVAETISALGRQREFEQALQQLKIEERTRSGEMLAARDVLIMEEQQKAIDLEDALTKQTLVYFEDMKKAQEEIAAVQEEAAQGKITANELTKEVQEITAKYESESRDREKADRDVEEKKQELLAVQKALVLAEGRGTSLEQQLGFREAMMKQLQEQSEMEAKIAESEIQSRSGLGMQMALSEIEDLKEQLEKLRATPSGPNIPAKDVRLLSTAPIVLSSNEASTLIEGAKNRQALNLIAKREFGIEAPQTFRNMNELKKEMYRRIRESKREIARLGGRKGRRKARSAQAIKVTRADGSGKDLGLVTAEVMVGVNIISDIKTGIRDVFGGRSKSGQVKLQDAMNILIEELKTRASAMGATSISHFHAEPFVYGGSGSIIGLYGYGVARKGGTRKASMAFKMEEERKIQVKARKADVEAFTDKYLDTVIRNRMTTNQFTVKPHEIAAENAHETATYKADYDELMKKFHPSAFYDGNNDESEEVRKLIIEHLQDLYGFSEIHLSPQGYLTVRMRDQGARRKAKRKARADMVDLILPAVGSVGTLVAQRINAWWQKRKGTLPATQKDLSSLATVEDIEAIKAGMQDDVASLVESFSALQEELNNSQTPQLAATVVAAELAEQIPQPELEEAIEVLEEDAPEIVEEVSDLVANLEDTRPFNYWTPYGFVTIEVPDMVFSGNEFALQYFELYTATGDEHIEVIHDNKRFVFPRSSGTMKTAAMGVADTFGPQAAAEATESESLRLLDEFAKAYGFDTTDPNEISRTIMPTSEYEARKEQYENPPSERKYKGMIIKKSGKMWNVEAFDKDFKTLKGARDFISKKVSGAASANGPCPRVIGKTKCKGTVILVRNRWKCKACKAEFREA